MAKPTGTGTPPLNLPPLPNPFDEDESEEQKTDKDAQRQEKEKGQPHFKPQAQAQRQQDEAQSGPQSESPPQASNRPRARAGTWKAGDAAPSSTLQKGASANPPSSANLQSTNPLTSPRTAATGTGGGTKPGAIRFNLGHARIASHPVSPLAGTPDAAVKGAGGGTPSTLATAPKSVPPKSAPPKVPKLSPVPPLVFAPSSAASASTTSLSPSTSNLPSPSASSPPGSPPATQKPGTVERDVKLKGEDLPLRIRAIVDAGLQQGAILAPEQLGELMVFVQSRGGNAPLTAATKDAILRGALKILDYTTASGVVHKEINVIEKFCEPFMAYHLNTPEIDEVRRKTLRAFDNVAVEFHEAIAGLRPAQQVADKGVSALMKPVEQLFMGLMCGEAFTLASSKLPEKVKALLLAVDKHVVLWFGKTGNGKPRDLLEVRKNAQVGFLSTRSLMQVWLNRNMAELGQQKAMEYTKMGGYLNSCVAHNVDDFVMDIVIAQKEQPEEARKYAKAIHKPKQLTGKGGHAAVTASGHSGLRRAKTLLPTSGLRSPRNASTTDAPDSSRLDETARAQKRELMKQQLERAKFAEAIIRDAGLSTIDPRFMQHLKNKVVEMSRRGFDVFQRDPIRHCLKYAQEFYAEVKNARHKKARPDALNEVTTRLSGLADKYRQAEGDQEDDSEESASPPVHAASVLAATGSAASANLEAGGVAASAGSPTQTSSTATLSTSTVPSGAPVAPPQPAPATKVGTSSSDTEASDSAEIGTEDSAG